MTLLPEVETAITTAIKLHLREARPDRRGRLLLAVGVLTPVAIALIALVLLVPSHARRSALTGVTGPHSASRGPARAPAAVDPQIVRSFRVFRRPRLSSDVLPRTLRSIDICGGEGPGNYSFCDVNVNVVAPPGSPVPENPGPAADASNGWQLVLYGHAYHLQVAASRRVQLPAGLGAIYLIPAEHDVCAYLNGPRWTRYVVRFRCGPIDLVLRRPPIDFPGFFFGPTRHGIMMAAEPDEITHATLAYPGGHEPVLVNADTLVACVGQGPYTLQQTTNTGRQIKPIRVGAYGQFRAVSCPALHLHAP